MGKFLEYLLNESSFSRKDFSKHLYAKDVLNYILNNKKICLGKSNIERIIQIDDLKDFKELSKKDFTIDDFNTVAKKFNFLWTDIFKGSFSKRGAGLDDEFKQVNTINKFIEDHGDGYFMTIPIRNSDGKTVYALSAKKIPKTPKADIAIYGFDTKPSENNFNDEVKPVIWISLKKGKKPTDFSQYGGISSAETKNASQKAKETIYNFIVGYKILFTDNDGYMIQPIYDVSSNEIDDSLFRYSIYGRDAYKNEFGENNVNFIIQGDITLNKKNNEVYELGGAFIEANPNIPEGDRRPRFCSKTAEDRITYNIKGVRIVIAPLAYHKSAKDLLDELNKKFSRSDKTLKQFINEYLKDNKIKDFFHNTGKNTFDEILAYKLYNKI